LSREEPNESGLASACASALGDAHCTGSSDTACHVISPFTDKQPKAAEARSGIETESGGPAPSPSGLALLRPQATGSARRRLCRFFSGSRVCQPAACHATRTRAGRRRKDHRARERRSARRIFGARASCRSAFCCPPLRRPSAAVGFAYRSACPRRPRFHLAILFLFVGIHLAILVFQEQGLGQVVG
jgi:hypothetical protein